MFRSTLSLVMITLSLIILVGINNKAHAVQAYCVGTVAELRNALDQAEMDGDDSRIDLRIGTFNFISELRYEPVLEYINPAGSLTIEGGYGSGCASRVDDASLTILQSNNGEKFVIKTETATVVMKTMTFDQTEVLLVGNPVLSENPCVSNNLKLEARRVRMLGGKLSTVSQCHNTVLRDSLFTNASDGTALDVHLSQDEDHLATTLTMINNTVAEGRLYIYSCCDSLGTAFLYNNVFRNSGTEISAVSTNVFALNNRYDSLAFSTNNPLPAGILVPGSANNLTSNPDLDANYRPNVGSTMVNSGTSAVPGGLLTIDLYGGPRVIGSAVDRGALESPVDGTGTYTVTNVNASGSGSLSDAINLANAESGFNTIKFNISGDCPRRITLSAGVSLQGSTLIDGWSQPGSIKNTEESTWNAVPCVILDGGNTVSTGIVTASQLGSGHLQIRGLAFERFSTAILLTFGTNHHIFGNQFADTIGASGPLMRGNNIAITIAGTVSGAIIGGGDAANRNLIGSSATAGVQITGPSTRANQVVNNLIGLDKDLVFALPNLDGVSISAKENTVTGNHISRNTRDGVVLKSANAHDNAILDNAIGGSIVSGPFSALGNGRMGVLIDNDAYGNTIGPDNRIGKNGDSGVRVLSAAGGHNAIIANRINLSGSPGIDLGANGASPNDADPAICDITTGCAANRGQNFPVIESALRVAAGNVVGLNISASLYTTYSSDPYRIDFYRSSDCNTSGHGEGSYWIGSKNIVVTNSGFCANNNCFANFSFGTLNDPAVMAGDVISATATSPNGDTSEFAACAIVEDVISDRIFADGFD